MAVKEDEEQEGEKEAGEEEWVKGAEVIQARLEEVQASQEQMIEVMDQLQGSCIYCRLIRGGHGRQRGVEEGGHGVPHGYKDCGEAEEGRCGIEAYKRWREGIDLGEYQHCYKCGLSQKICRRLEDDGWCEYPEVMLPGMFILHQRQHLCGVAEVAGFQGDYSEDVWEWFKEQGEGFGREWESNWMRTWRMVCQMYEVMRRGREERVG
jgi:hypothetical protein